MYPYVGEIRMFPGNFAPVGYYFCDGALLPIADYEPLFSLIGTTYGGDGSTTFALPDLRGRIPVHQGNSPHGSYTVGQRGGSEQRTLTASNIPSHSHSFVARASEANTETPSGSVIPAATTGNLLYNNAPVSTVPMHPNTIQTVGNGLPIGLHMPILAINFIIAYVGIYPVRS